MQKDNLQYLVTQMYDKLIDIINEDSNVEKMDIVSYLRDSIDVIIDIPENEPLSNESLKLAFDDAFKEVANKGISSYKHTNEKFQTLARMHEETLSKCSNDTIDIPNITDKFNDIQNLMTDEIKKANDIIVKLSNQVDKLEKDSNIDSLTKTFNRRALTTLLTSLCEKKIASEVHLVILDIDDFKLINDKYGYIAGDKILIFIARILKKTLRDGDKVFRYGGEEFILILNRIDVIHCEKIILRILDLIGNNKLIYKGENLSVTVSMGTTVLTENDTPDSIIHRADKALYRAKEDGKNRFYTELAHGN